MLTFGLYFKLYLVFHWYFFKKIVNFLSQTFLYLNVNLQCIKTVTF